MGRKEGQAPPAVSRPYRLKTDGHFLVFKGDLPAGYANEMRAFFDRALEGGQATLDKGTWPLWEAMIKRDMAIVRRARASDPVKVQTARDLWSVILPACANLERYASAPAMETSAKRNVVKAAIAGRSWKASASDRSPT